MVVFLSPGGPTGRTLQDISGHGGTWDTLAGVSPRKGHAGQGHPDRTVCLGVSRRRGRRTPPAAAPPRTQTRLATAPRPRTTAPPAGRAGRAPAGLPWARLRAPR